MFPIFGKLLMLFVKSLLIPRHAKLSWKYPDLPDHDRPLNKRGKNDAPRDGKAASERKPHS
jgi:phosphohistidine phosphatase